VSAGHVTNAVGTRRRWGTPIPLIAKPAEGGCRPTSWPAPRRSGPSNEPTGGHHSGLQHLRGSALGFRRLTNYIARSSAKNGGENSTTARAVRSWRTASFEHAGR